MDLSVIIGEIFLLMVSVILGVLVKRCWDLTNAVERLQAHLQHLQDEVTVIRQHQMQTMHPNVKNDIPTFVSRYYKNQS
jgi:hypothetical protein